MIRALAAATVCVLGLAACSANDTGDEPTPPTPNISPSPTAHAHGGDVPDEKPLRPGERRIELAMPEAYTPSAPMGVGTDDYRCFLLDPGLDEDAFITGTDVNPGNPAVVHHVILFRVPRDLVGVAEATDAAAPGQGWTCFGNAGVGGQRLDDAPWLGAWAPGGGESVHKAGYGVPLERGSRIVMQVHYNLLAGSAPDVSATRLRIAPGDARLHALSTMLLPAPVELPCRPEHADGRFCERTAALAEVKRRFGQGPGATADVLHWICGDVAPGNVQSCTRPVVRPMTIHGVAGHMHLLGRKIRIEANPGTPRARTLLDIAVWNFDDQGAVPINPLRLRPGDTVRVTCRHEQWLRDELPAFEGQPDRYVLWGEGTTDEMCLGILQVTYP